MSAVGAVLAGLTGLPQRPGTPVLCVDGPAGSGKTTLAAAVAAAVPGARVVHMDDLFEGWSGLPQVDRQLAGLLGPLAEDRPGRYRRWDWHADAWAEQHVVEPGALVVVEGVGSGCWRSPDLLVWVEAPRELRLRRGLERDGEAFAPYWEQWAADEQRLFARERTRERADLLVDGRDGTVLSRPARRRSARSWSTGG